jgi:hypothetical protein
MMRWEGNVSAWDRCEMHTVISLENLKGRGQLEDLCVDKGKVVPVLFNERHAMKAYCGSGGIAPRILDLGTRCR